MIHLPASVRVYLCLTPCDMRKSFDSLHALVRDHLELDALAGHLFVFTSRRRDRVKILYWDRDGFAVWSKRLEEGTYAVPFGDGGSRTPARDHGAGVGSAAERHRSEHGEAAQAVSARELIKHFRPTIVFAWNRARFPRNLDSRWRSIRTACRETPRRCGRSSWIWPSNWIVRWRSRTNTRGCCANCWRRSATAKASSCRKSNWRCSRRPGRRGMRKPNPPPPSTTTIWMAIRERRRSRTKLRARSAAGASLWPRHLKRERMIHDLAEAEKHCDGCGKDLRLIAEEISERYEYIPASMKVIQDVCLKYACECTVRTATKPPQPIEKGTAGASLLAQVIVAKWADHQPLHRQEKMFERHGIEISRKTMGGWMAQCAALLDPLYQVMKKELLSSKVIGTDDTSVKVLDRKLPFARIGRIWPYLGDAQHPVIVYDYTPTRSRAGPAKFLEGYKGYLQADAYSVYDAFFKPQRGMTEVGCWMHARRYFFKALESDEAAHGAGAALDRAPICRGGARPRRCRYRRSSD